MYKKITAIALMMSLTFPLISNENPQLITTEKETYAWSKQVEYMDILKELKTKFEILNNKLSNCRETFFLTTTEDSKKVYLLETNDYSTNILVTQALVTQALDNLDVKIKQDKSAVMKNLIDGFDKLDSYIEYEKNRKDNLIKNYQKEYQEIKLKYCASQGT